MKKVQNLALLLAVGLASWFLLPVKIEAAAVTTAVEADSAYKAIVKIYVYTEDKDNYLTQTQSGSGALISKDGVILTNHHVVTVEDSFGNEAKTVFQVCITYKTSETPVCNYSAALIAKNEDYDIALLKIKNTDASSRSQFDYLQRATNEYFPDGLAVKALGYPSIGGNTITITEGEIISTIEDDSAKWIKNTALISFGSSGGALINESGRLLGITSKANSEIGYAIHMYSINDWVERNMSKNPTYDLSLQQRITNLINTNYAMLKENNFSNYVPNFTFNKKDNWEFSLVNENKFITMDIDEPNSGYIIVNWQKNETAVEPGLETIKKLFLLSYNNCFDGGSQEFNGKNVARLTCTDGDDDLTSLLIGENNYFIKIDYYYGKNNISQPAIDQMLERFIINSSDIPYVEQKTYTNSNPYFKMDVPDNWAVMGLNSSSRVLTGSNTSFKGIGFIVYIDELTDSLKNLSNQEYFSYFKGDEPVKANNEYLFDLEAEIYDKNVDFTVNSNIENQILVKYRFKDTGDLDAVKFYSAAYIIRAGNRAIIIGFDYLGEDQNIFEQQLADFQKNVMVNFSLDQHAGQASYVPLKLEPIESEQTESSQEAEQLEQQEQIVEAAPVQLITKEIKKIGNNLKGKIILQVEDRGKAWYISPESDKAYYLGRKEDAYQVMREQGVGITNNDLAKIPVALANYEGYDTDGDGLSDAFETAIGTSYENKDTDGDGYDDKSELFNGYSPQIKMQKLNYNQAFSDDQKGKIFLQVESRGEAWYVNPTDGKRYFLGTAEDAYNLMRTLSLGISNSDFENL